ncbi:hypothetical protein Pint_32403 [Pistacia integerrima]|uniref:Uncharacterized protein n=1 Tax=Pistacia integerrima TaxID=434235 RepID=A0ACC0XQF5_9ROSI|nr:hypothetical protein Pint_32403 [Pistacia integerrima]
MRKKIYEDEGLSPKDLTEYAGRGKAESKRRESKKERKDEQEGDIQTGKRVQGKSQKLHKNSKRKS